MKIFTAFYITILVVFNLTFSFTSHAKDQTINVVFIVPDKEGPAFWSLVKEVALSAASDLDIKLEVIYSDSDRFAILSSVDRIIQRKIKPDYVVVRPFWGSEEKVIKRLIGANIPFVTLESAYDSNQIDYNLLKTWISRVEYDNIRGGKMLAESLIRTAAIRYGPTQVEVVGLGGDFDLVSLHRQKYLVNLHKVKNIKVLVHQIVPFYWSPTAILAKVPTLLKRYPKAKVIWSAGDEMALAALQATRSSSGRYIIGGFDWLPQALVEIEKGNLHASVGGHFLMAAHALIDIYNYHHGFTDKEMETNKRQYELIDASNVSEYIEFFDQEGWKTASFVQFTKSALLKSQKIETEKTQLTVENLIDQVRTQKEI